MSPKSRKRRRHSVDEGRVDCPFTVTTITQQSSDRTSKKRKPDDGDKVERQLIQLSPFKPEGQFESNQIMYMLYTIEPRKRWQDMTRYNNFVWNGHKYRADDFVYVANDDSIAAQKAPSIQEDGSLPKLTHYWVAKILEIRAADEHHVYARIYWMYSPDELPPNTRHGEETIEGRQPYHGKDELIASNHMDVINVVSVIAEAQVHQWIELNDEEFHDALYWRQAFDLATLQLSVAELVCKCRTPTHPDELLVGCTTQDCGQWLHEKCLRNAVIKQVYERLGSNKPYPPETVCDMNPFLSNIGKVIGGESYDNLFKATLIMRDGPMAWEIADHRPDFAGTNSTWRARVHCLICDTIID